MVRRRGRLDQRFGAEVDAGQVSVSEFAPEFKAELWEPAKWAEIFERAGARYVVSPVLDEAVMDEHGIEPIDLLVVNLYPFEATIARDDATIDDAIENIDIGGPAMIRAAAKNHGRVGARRRRPRGRGPRRRPGRWG